MLEPRFLPEGNAVRGAEFPGRIVIGSEGSQAITKLEDFEELHGGYISSMIRSSYENAVLIKYAINASLAMKVTFIPMIIARLNCRANHTAVPGTEKR